jgi:hypothetical protein
VLHCADPGRLELGPPLGSDRQGQFVERDHRDFPQLVPDLQVNFRTRSEPDGRLTTVADPIPPVPPKPCAWADASEDLSVAGRLLK